MRWTYRDDALREGGQGQKGVKGSWEGVTADLLLCTRTIRIILFGLGISITESFLLEKSRPVKRDETASAAAG